jgi:hypothetical protein
LFTLWRFREESEQLGAQTRRESTPRMHRPQKARKLRKSSAPGTVGNGTIDAV